MHYEIYVDAVFLENMIADLVAILLTQELLYKKKRYIRSFIGAIIGAVIGVARIVCGTKLPFSAVVLYLIGCYITMIISFAKIKQIFVQLCCVHGFLMLIGAVLFVIRRLLMWYEIKVSIGCFCFYVALFYLLGILCLTKYHERQREKSKKLYKVWIYFDQNPITATALLDTGNQLKEPVSHKPVSVLESRICKDKGDMSIQDKEYCCIPFQSIGKESGILHGLHAQKIQIQLDGKVIEQKDVIIAFYQGRLSKDDSFQMILQPELLQN